MTPRIGTPDQQIAGVEKNLESMGHKVTGDIDRDVDVAIDVERERAWTFRKQVAAAIGASEDTALSPAAADLLDRLRAAVGPDGVTAAYWQAEAQYWRHEAENAQSVVDSARRALNAIPSVGRTRPPEPPVGTSYVDDIGSQHLVRRDDGWYCDDPGCEGCPADWRDTWAYEVGPAAREKRAAKYGEALDRIVRRLPGETS